MQYWYTARFLRSLKKCNVEIQDDVLRAVQQFETGTANEMLKLHKLLGKFKSYRAFSANFSYRVLIKIVKQNVYYVDVGTHSIYL